MLTRTLGQMASNGHQRTSTIYDWPSGWTMAGEGWTSITGGIAAVEEPGHLILGPQQSGALQGTQRWRRDQPITVRGKIAGWAWANNRFFAGLALMDPESNDTNYFELCVGFNVAPFNIMQGPSFGCLTGNGVHETGVRYGAYSPHEWRDMEISWMPQEQLVRYSVDGVVCGTWGGMVMNHNPTIWLGCVSVPEGVGEDGSRAKAAFKAVEVLGVRV